MPGAQASGTAVPAAVAMNDAAGGGESQRRESAVPDDGESSQLEKNLNCFVRVVATGELVGNALGTLASLWATVVLLGGYRSSLKHVDFWIATAMVFLQAFRVFIGNFKLDSQSLFGSTKAFNGWLINSPFVNMLCRPQKGDEIVLIICVVMTIFDLLPNWGVYALVGSITQTAIGILISRTPLITETMMRQLRRRPKVLWALMLIPLAATAFNGSLSIIKIKGSLEGPLSFLLGSLSNLMQVVALVLLYFRPQRITTLISHPRGRLLLIVSKGILILLAQFTQPIGIFSELVTVISTVVLLLGSLQDPEVPNRMLLGSWIDGILHMNTIVYVAFPFHIDIVGGFISTIGLVTIMLIGNLQIPVTVAQIALSSWRLVSSHGDSANMVASIRVFYALVLCQGLLYFLACALALFSVIPRRSLARRSGFGDDWGPRAVDLYYKRAYTKRIEIGVFAEDTISLASFVVDSLNSASSISRELHFSASKARELQLVGVRVLHCLLQQKGSSSEELISVITRSEKAVPTLISMLDWTFNQDKDIRLLAAKATADLASYLRIAGNAGAVRLVSSLLDAKNDQPPSKNDEGNSDDGSLGPPKPADGNNEIGGCTRNEQGRNCYQRWCSWICKCWQRMKKNWPMRSMEKKSINSPQDYSIPVLGMKILERLACDPDNCIEIMKNKNLISKIIGFISYTSNDKGNNDNALIVSSPLGPHPASGNNEIRGRTRNEPPLNSQDSLPVLGMMILEKLTSYPDNCAEIVKNKNLISKITGLISYTSNDGSSNDSALIVSSSLGPRPAGDDNEIGGRTRNKPPLTSQDSLPVLMGMKILERLTCDPDNYAEIVKNTNLIPNIIGLISYTSNDGSSNDNALIVSSSLNFLRMIGTTNGKAGATLWQELWESPLLLRNLTCVLQDNRSSLEVWKPAIDIIATLALDEVARHELGRVKVIIHNLLHIFIIEQDGRTNYDQLLRVAAGAALSNLAMENPENCLAMLEERQTFAECSRNKDQMSNPEVSNQVSAALRVTFDACSRIKGWLSDPRVTNQLSSALRLVLQNIMAAENKQLEALIGLASQIFYVLPPRRFVQGLESRIIERPIVEKLVNTLNSNKKPSHEYPRMRRAIVDMVISVLRHSPGDAIIFRTEGAMVDALSKVEMTPSKVEKYRVFLSKEGVVLEHGLPLRDLVATAKGLIHHATPT
ncbi:hypothetical protein HU200_051091 [Digitaria exilis]|uniref:Uncharacterized protein n=1 Tax=Digitaria exilis TaxID=1010633 RepID=A0A835E715_9POAL|nr:hypothetical protein HU200_051091 [Digitaria exilis]